MFSRQPNKKKKTEASNQGHNDHRRTYHLLSGRKCHRESDYSEHKGAKPNLSGVGKYIWLRSANGWVGVEGVWFSYKLERMF